MNNNKYKIGQTDRIEGMIQGLQRKLEELAPHPNKNHHLAPLFSTVSNGNVISAAFNRKNAAQAGLEAWRRDLPARLRLERRISDLKRLQHSLTPALPELAFA